MEVYDIIMLVIVIGAALFGAVKGFAWQLASIASIVVSYIVAYRFREPFSQSIQIEWPWNRFLAMLILFIGTSLVIWVGFRMISKTIDRFKLREFDRQMGALFGLAKGGLYCILITLFAVTLLGDFVRTKVVASKSGHFIASVLDKTESVIPGEIHQIVRPYLERFDEQFAATKSARETGQNQTQMPWSGQPNQSPATQYATGLSTNPQYQNPPAQNAPAQTYPPSGQQYQNSGQAWPPRQQYQAPTGGYQQAQQPQSVPSFRGF